MEFGVTRRRVVEDARRQKPAAAPAARCHHRCRFRYFSSRHSNTGASLRLSMDRQRARGGLNDAGAGAGASLGPPAQVSSMAWREQASSQLRCNGGSARYTAMCEGGKWYEMMKRT